MNNPDKKPTVSCPICKTKVVWSELQLNRPFCSERCKLIDLGEWAAEKKRISGDSLHSESATDSFVH